MKFARMSVWLLCTLGFSASVSAQDSAPGLAAPTPGAIDNAFPAKAPYSPYVGRNFPTCPYFGDTHLHTSFSMDAGAFGARLTPSDAYTFAKGNEITASMGERVKLSRPLDFLVVADHSDGMGFCPLIFSGAPAIMADPQGRNWNEMVHNGQGAAAAIDIIVSFSNGKISKAIMPLPGTTMFLQERAYTSPIWYTP
ncbi:MAG: DUF3604 domain-containing protein [Woeseiaceae bacterium]|nr:DUF3604 domain-containing protein [Woeseiaceae bacterium]